MKTACQIFFFLCTGLSVYGQQFYVRGEVKDESGNPLQDVSILLHATGYVYHTGRYGSFGILTNKSRDTLSFWLDGYQKEKRLVIPDNYVTVRLKLNPTSSSSFHNNKLVSFTKGLNKEIQLMVINVNSKKLDLDTLPPSNLVFLIDISGSMDMPNRLPLLQSAFRLLVNNLRAKDTVTVVVYGGVTGVKLNATSGGEKEKILKVIDELEPGGFTPGESGIRLAYNVAQSHFIKGGNNRVILATDGDFNVGLKTE